MIGFAMCGSFCTHSNAVTQLEGLFDCGHDILPIMSDTVYSTDTRFGKACDLIEKCENICGHKVVHTIKDAEPLGPKIQLECLIICPCTGNTLAKIANGITDTSVTMAVKAHLRNNKPVILGIATNDALGASFKNIGILSNTKNIYFVPLSQDDPKSKFNSLVCNFSLIPETIEAALSGKQLQPVFNIAP